MSISNKGLDPVQYPGKKKTVSTFKLSVDIAPGAMIGHDTWLPAEHDMIDMPFEDLVVTVVYDDTVLIEPQSLTAPIALETQLVDDHNHTEHVLRIVLSGKSEKHTVKFDGTDKDAVATLKVNLSIESLPINYCLEGQPVFFAEGSTDGQNWAEYLAQNGEQRVSFSTPIYSWLIAQQNGIIHDIKQSSQKGL